GVELIESVVDSIVGLGPLEPLLRRPDVTDVLVNGPDEVWVERAGRLERASVTFADDAAVVAAVERVIAPLGLRLDRASPAVDARLPDGSRLHAVIPPRLRGRASGGDPPFHPGRLLPRRSRGPRVCWSRTGPGIAQRRGEAAQHRRVRGDR